MHLVDRAGTSSVSGGGKKGDFLSVNDGSNHLRERHVINFSPPKPAFAGSTSFPSTSLFELRTSLHVSEIFQLVKSEYSLVVPTRLQRRGPQRQWTSSSVLCLAIPPKARSGAAPTPLSEIAMPDFPSSPRIEWLRQYQRKPKQIEYPVEVGLLAIRPGIASRSLLPSTAFGMSRDRKGRS